MTGRLAVLFQRILDLEGAVKSRDFAAIAVAHERLFLAMDKMRRDFGRRKVQKLERIKATNGDPNA